MGKRDKYPCKKKKSPNKLYRCSTKGNELLMPEVWAAHSKFLLEDRTERGRVTFLWRNCFCQVIKINTNSHKSC